MRPLLLICILTFITTSSFCLDPFPRVTNLLQRGEYREAIALLNKEIIAAEARKDWNIVAKAHTIKSGCELQVSEFPAAMASAASALTIAQMHLGKNSLPEAEAYSMIGKIHLQKAEYDKSLEYHEKALAILSSKLNDHDPRIGEEYLLIRKPFAARGESHLALEYDQKALAIFKSAYGESHVNVGKCYFNIGAFYFASNSFSDALQYFNRALKVYSLTSGPESIEVADVYRTVGRIHIMMGQWNEVIDTQKKGLSIYEHVTHGKNPFMILFYWNLADAYAQIGKKTDALIYYTKAIDKARELVGPKHPALVSSYLRLGEFYKQQGNLDLALANYQQSIIANMMSFNDADPFKNPRIAGYLDHQQLLICMKAKATALREMYSEKKTRNLLEACLNTYQGADTLIDQKRRSYKNMDDKVASGIAAKSVYEGAVESSFKLYDVSKDVNFLEQAFHFSEKSKASVLNDVLMELSVKGLNIIPPRIIQAEKELMEQKTSLQSAILQAGTAQSPELTARKNNLFALNRKIDSLMMHVKKEYPRYHALAYSKAPIGLDSLQEALNKNSALVEFFDADTTVYIFGITKQKAFLKTIRKDSALNHTIDNFLSSLKSETTLTSQPTQAFTKFVDDANGLYKILLGNFLDDLASEATKELIIIPDGNLAYIPFELLLLRPAGADQNYNHLHYLITKYAVSYGYSASLNFNKRCCSESNSIATAAFAPEYPKALDSSAVASLGRFRGDVMPLKWNVAEAEEINGIVGGMTFTGRDATEATFKVQANKYNVLHLAMHALVDDEQPMNSKLIFSKGGGSEDGYLHVFELYGMSLPADLVVLSACNTATGKMAHGEGIMSMARGFAYAGVPSVVMSHWKVDDEATSVLMKLFYTGLDDGMTKSEALQQAKLQYLKLERPGASHPFYWGAFVQVGDNSAIVKQNNPWMIVFYIGLGGLLIALIWAIKRSRKAV